MIWFALLQTVTPFIHAHLEADDGSQPHGLHVHLAGLPDEVPTIKNLALPTHVIGIDQAVVKNMDALPLPIFALLFVLSLQLFLAGTVRAPASFPLLIPQYLRSLSRPRAPPRP